MSLSPSLLHILFPFTVLPQYSHLYHCSLLSFLSIVPREASYSLKVCPTIRPKLNSTRHLTPASPPTLNHRQRTGQHQETVHQINKYKGLTIGSQSPHLTPYPFLVITKVIHHKSRYTSRTSPKRLNSPRLDPWKIATQPSGELNQQHQGRQASRPRYEIIDTSIRLVLLII